MSVIGDVVFLGGRDQPRVRISVPEMQRFASARGEPLDLEGDEKHLIVVVDPRTGRASFADGAAWIPARGRPREVGGRIGLSHRSIGILEDAASAIYADKMERERFDRGPRIHANPRKPSAAELRRIRDAEIDEACRNRYPCDGCGARGVPIAPLVSGGPRFCQRCHEAAGQPKARRPNPALILVTGNPAPGTVEKAWCKFHQRDVYDGRSESFGIIRGMPPFVFALGKCKSLEIDGAARPFTPQPWLVCSPDDESLWIVTKDVMNLGSGAAGRAIEAITYDPPRESGKTPAYYRHEFDKPLPVLTPVGDPHRCRAVLLDGGAYSVSDWIHE